MFALPWVLPSPLVTSPQDKRIGLCRGNALLRSAKVAQIVVVAGVLVGPTFSILPENTMFESFLSAGRDREYGAPPPEFIDSQPEIYVQPHVSGTLSVFLG